MGLKKIGSINKTLKGILLLTVSVSLQPAFAEDSKMQSWTPPAQAGLGPFTNLGSSGNAAVRAQFEAYNSRFPGGACAGISHLQNRVILTGFGLFAGVDYNISGLVVSSIMESSFTPQSLSLSSAFRPGSAPANRRPRSGVGVHAATRVLNIDGTEVGVCGLILDVKWDLAGAIVVREMRAVQPQIVVMSGRGTDKVIFEGGAVNSAVSSSGFDSNGTALSGGRSSNVPQSDWVLDNLEEDTLRMTWQRNAFSSRVNSIARGLGYDTQYPRSARSENNYICNNISLIAAAAAEGYPTSLAGGEVYQEGLYSGNTAVGFLHFPIVDTEISESRLSGERNKIAEWARLMLTVAFSQL